MENEERQQANEGGLIETEDRLQKMAKSGHDW